MGKISPTELSSFSVPFSTFLPFHHAKTFLCLISHFYTICAGMASPNPKIFPEKCEEFYHAFSSPHPTIRGLQEEETGNWEIRIHAGTFLPLCLMQA